MISIVDYGMGNVRSVQKGMERCGYEAVITRDPKILSDSSHLILPGVGAFPDCMNNLARFHLIEPILREIEKGKPFLGICLGFQLLYSESEEFGSHPGLNLLKGRVVRFPEEWGDGKDGSVSGSPLKIPHMGWNQVKLCRPSPLFKGLRDETYFYFVHSYYVFPEEKNWTTSVTDYGIEFASSVWKDHLFACQFHPEKSQGAGLKILRNFGEFS